MLACIACRGPAKVKCACVLRVLHLSHVCSRRVSDQGFGPQKRRADGRDDKTALCPFWDAVQAWQISGFGLTECFYESCSQTPQGATMGS